MRAYECKFLVVYIFNPRPVRVVMENVSLQASMFNYIFHVARKVYARKAKARLLNSEFIEMKNISIIPY